MRNVGAESKKTYEEKLDADFFNKFMRGPNITRGCGLDIGYAGYEFDIVPILPNAIGIDFNYPGYDGKTLPFSDNSQDYVYSSHCLEHITDYKSTIQEWFRVVKKHGHIIIVVPHRDLYEKKLQLPSIWNADHKRFYTPASLLKEVEDSLPINSFRVRHLKDNDEGHDYNQPANEHSKGQYEIELVIERII